MRSSLYFMFLGPPSLKFLDPLLNTNLNQIASIITTQLTSNANFVLNGSQWDFNLTIHQIEALNINMLSENQFFIYQRGGGVFG